MIEKLVNTMAELDEDALFDEIRAEMAAGTSTDEIMASLQDGMFEVGRRFQTQEYFLTDLIMSGELFKESVELLGLTEDESVNSVGTFLIGTVYSDIHDIGKNIAASVLKSNGFKVVDIGINVPKEDFVKAVREAQPQIIGISCLLTTAFDHVKELINALKAEGLTEGRFVIIGGGPVDAHTVAYTGADAYCNDAQDGMMQARKFLGV
ncbi:cobalamin-dependent protein [Dehalobacter sp. DCM]|uniref:cobalamin B12-binding domain-containing protein n=1 Tax=Dehalobacter sp. DCM TaxID=2907827 RepID=UPI0030814E56|nr:cobalamin-dependent protein [Dehalobacter sp. DCM]